MIAGKCPKCGIDYFGWSLLNPRNQMCIKCGTALQITDGDSKFTGFSPFTADEYVIKQTQRAPVQDEKR